MLYLVLCLCCEGGWCITFASFVLNSWWHRGQAQPWPKKGPQDSSVPCWSDTGTAVPPLQEALEISTWHFRHFGRNRKSIPTYSIGEVTFYGWKALRTTLHFKAFSGKKKISRTPQVWINEAQTLSSIRMGPFKTWLQLGSKQLQRKPPGLCRSHRMNSVKHRSSSHPMLGIHSWILISDYPHDNTSQVTSAGRSQSSDMTIRVEY